MSLANRYKLQRAAGSTMHPKGIGKYIGHLIVLVLVFINPIDARHRFINVSYDATRELYKEINELFLETSGLKDSITLYMSNGGSGKQARSVVDGLQADVVTLALAYDIDEIANKSGLIDPAWQKRFPYNSTPFVSTIVFLVRKGNPLGIRDWDDLIKPGVTLVTPNPKTSGGARWNYLAAWSYASLKYGKDSLAEQFIDRLYKNVPVLDAGARGSATTFVLRNIGDVLLTWENEAHLVKSMFPEKVEIVTPSISVRTEPPVAIVDSNALQHGTFTYAKKYCEFLFTPAAQNIGIKNFFRSVITIETDETLRLFPQLVLVSVDTMFGGWMKAQKVHFSDGGVFDRIYLTKKEK